MPIGVHGDDGRYNKPGDKVILLTCNFLLARDADRNLVARLLLRFFFNLKLKYI